MYDCSLEKCTVSVGTFRTFFWAIRAILWLSWSKPDLKLQSSQICSNWVNGRYRDTYRIMPSSWLLTINNQIFHRLASSKYEVPIISVINKQHSPRLSVSFQLGLLPDHHHHNLYSSAGHILYIQKQKKQVRYVQPTIKHQNIQEKPQQ